LASQYQLPAPAEDDLPAINFTFKDLRLPDDFLSMPLSDYQSHGSLEVVDANTVAESKASWDTVQLPKRFAAPLARWGLARSIEVDSTPIQIWEGTVVSIDTAEATMHVLLDAKMGSMPRHTGEIELEWVTEQDQDLVKPGAIFYLTLFKRTKRGSIENTQELRFRRRPSWSAAQIKQIDDSAAMIRSKMKPLPSAA
jgi:hypothetical protein